MDEEIVEHKSHKMPKEEQDATHVKKLKKWSGAEEIADNTERGDDEGKLERKGKTRGRERMREKREMRRAVREEIIKEKREKEGEGPEENGGPRET